MAVIGGRETEREREIGQDRRQEERLAEIEGRERDLIERRRGHEGMHEKSLGLRQRVGAAMIEHRRRDFVQLPGWNTWKRDLAQIECEERSSIECKRIVRPR